MKPKVKQDASRRMSRIVGQVAGIKSMVEEERYCVDILDQIAAARAALSQVAMIVLRGHLETCVTDAVRRGRAKTLFDELDEALPRFFR